ncbi:MAG TPA: 4-alpha-glucanotransferase, partial [Actinomycetota bacterium]|nr:4-alpha-glucanotransferase [Actinomycetota bacterium]
PLPRNLPFGYHRLRVEADAAAEARLIVAPPAMHDGPRAAGVFAPVYAVRGERDYGCGDLGSFAGLIDVVSELGGSLVATLPILSAFMDEPFDPSPYAPVSRLHWNEIYLDIDAVPEFADSEQARALAKELAPKIRGLRRKQDVDYRGVSAVKRRVLEACAASLSGKRRREMDAWLRENPVTLEYARFRAETERSGLPWQAWPGTAKLRRGGDAEKYHVYAQWLMNEQLARAGREADDKGVHLYFDLPLGVHPDGFDTWRYGEVFAFGVSGGAPPDSFFTKGQNWRFPPLHPERIRETGYSYVIESLRALLRHARILRIDHVMSLHRLFWVPDGFDATDGVYVRSNPDEWYAILALESHRAGAAIVGEDLGTVPGEVRTAMARNNLLRSYVLQEELPDSPKQVPNPIPARALAGLNTHDMPTFASFWNGKDIDDRVGLGLFTPAQAEKERTRRAKTTKRLSASLRGRKLLKGRGADAALDASLALLAGGRARMRCVSIEDLWLEERQQNVPGTTSDEQPNWRHKLRYTLEEIRGDPAVAARIRTLTRR